MPDSLRATLALLAALAVSAVPRVQAADRGAADLSTRTCSALVARVDRIEGGGPALLRSYDGPAGDGPAPEPALKDAAFAYDNALAAIALVACGRLPQALRIGEALLAGATSDRSGEAGRLRNTYRAGAQAQRPLPPMGWWDAAAGHWAEDEYQVGTATGNVAWAALALLTLADAGAGPRFRDGAARLAGWAVANTRDARGPGGFTGGRFGYDDRARALGWKSTEHNVDLVAVFTWLARGDAGGRWAREARHARGFVEAMWDDARGRFAVGTAPDGTSVNTANAGLDAQLWPPMLPEAAPSWRRALAHAERAHGVDGGFDFNDDRDGVWVEGTAQAALAIRIAGRRADAVRLLDGLVADIAPGGYLWATRSPRITTGLALRPDSTTDDFHYLRRPHLAATAWAALAALGWNPFTGRTLN